MLCVATKILNLKAIPSYLFCSSLLFDAVRCNKNTKSESYSQCKERSSIVSYAVRCNKNTKSESYSQCG